MGHRNKRMQEFVDKRVKVKKKDEETGGEIKSIESKRKRVETYKLGDYFSKQVTKRNPKNDTEFIKKTKTRKDGTWEVEKENKRFWKRKVGGKTVEKYDKKKDKWVKGGPVEPAMSVKYDDLGPEGKKLWDELRNPH